MYFATANPLPTRCSSPCQTSFRPIKIDGNPDHAYNHGLSDVFSQGTLLELYDPDRSQHVTYEARGRDWADFAVALRDKVVGTKDGSGVYFLRRPLPHLRWPANGRPCRPPTRGRRWCRVDPAIAGTFLEKGYNVQSTSALPTSSSARRADFLSGASYPGFHKLVADYAKRRKIPPTA